MASRSHHWHLHLVRDFGTVVIRSPAPRLHAATAERREHTYANVHSSRLITEKTAARPRIQRGVACSKGNPPLPYRTFSGKARCDRERGRAWVWASLFYSLGDTSSRGCSLTLRTVLWCLCSGNQSYFSSRQRWDRTRAQFTHQFRLATLPRLSQLPRAAVKPSPALRSHSGEI